MILGSHNTMSYLKPAKWYMWPFRFIARCQDKTIYEQYALGIRVFDIRLKIKTVYDKKNAHYYKKLVFAHGLMEYKGADVNDIMLTISNWKDCKIRLIIEDTKTNKAKPINTHQLIQYTLEHLDLYIFDGFRRSDWTQIIYDPVLKPTPKYTQQVSSMCGKWYFNWFPRLYSWIYNKKIVKENKDNNDSITFIDFVGKYY